MVLLDRVFDLLTEERRRYALYYLQEDSPVSVDELAIQVVEWETNSAKVSLPVSEREEIKLELFYNDLPKASEAEYIRYNSEEGIVELNEEPHEIDAILAVAKVIERPGRNP